MAEEKTGVNELKSLLKEGNFIKGYSEVLKAVEKSETKKVYAAANAKQEQLDEIKKIAGFNGIEVVSVKLTNQELGQLFKKQYMISFIASLSK